jgi:hypothetical protein
LINQGDEAREHPNHDEEDVDAGINLSDSSWGISVEFDLPGPIDSKRKHWQSHNAERPTALGVRF